MGVALGPPETDAPLIIDANTVLPRPITAEFLEAVARRCHEVIERFRRVEQDQLSQHDALKCARVPLDPLTAEQTRRVAIRATLDHAV
jgi:hypothetical protein